MVQIPMCEMIQFDSIWESGMSLKEKENKMHP